MECFNQTAVAKQTEKSMDLSFCAMFIYLNMLFFSTQLLGSECLSNLINWKWKLVLHYTIQCN